MRLTELSSNTDYALLGEIAVANIIQSDEFIVGTILGEFLFAFDAQQFRAIKGPQRCVITAGINFPYAVRELRRVKTDDQVKNAN
jgi:hypothetical protein